MVISSARSSRRASGLGALAAIALCMGLAACGGGSKSASNPSASSRRGLFNDPKVVACLKKEGVTIPTGGGFRGRRGGAYGTSTNGTAPQRPTGTVPNGTQPTLPNGATRTAPNGHQFPGGGQFAQRFQKLQAALKKCGVTLPAFGNRGGNGPGAGGYGPGGPGYGPGVSTDATPAATTTGTTPAPATPTSTSSTTKSS